VNSPGRVRAFLLLFAVQGDWNYERMLGVGMGYAAEPLLDELSTRDPARHTAAVVRSAEFFNCNPNLAGLALGALARAERDGVPGEQVSRLRTALCGPLGALGDRLFWAGVVPALSALAIVAVVIGAGAWAIAGFLFAYNALRIGTGWWSLHTGLHEGLQVGGAVGRSWLPRAAERVGPMAGFAVGLAIPLAGRWLMQGLAPSATVLAVFLAAGGVALSRWGGTHYSAVRYAVVVLILLAAGGMVML
jgi:PTS system mannose-specific IID component